MVCKTCKSLADHLFFAPIKSITALHLRPNCRFLKILIHISLQGKHLYQPTNAHEKWHLSSRQTPPKSLNIKEIAAK